jgi:alpha-L-rhamnosidase
LVFNQENYMSNFEIPPTSQIEAHRNAPYRHNRRDFLKISSLSAAGISIGLPGIVFLSDSANLPAKNPESGMLFAQMIWAAEFVPVPLKLNGRAAGLSSSEDGRPPVAEPDLHAVFAREFSLDAVPTHASIRLFAYTRYRLYSNGIYCGRGPSRFQNQRPEYDTPEIGKVLHAGVNRVAVLVHRDSPTGRIMRHDPGFAAVIELKHGSQKQTIGTDTTWLSKPELCFGPRAVAWASIEEHIDARKGPDWSDDGLSLAGWSPSISVGGPNFFPVWPRMTPLQPETPVAWAGGEQHWPVSLQVGEEVSFDLAQIIQGYHLLELDADAGSELEIAYNLPEGKSSGESSYKARVGMQTYMGGDTFAFNRLAIRLKSGRIRLVRAAAVEVRYPFERVASFKCSDPLLSQLWAICARSLELLSEDAYVDCADRERVEWIDNSPPAFDCKRVMMRGLNDGAVEHWGDSRLLGALLRRIALTQQPDGQIKAHSCSERWDIHAIMEDRSCDWAVLLREYYDSSADKQLVKELWPALTRLMQWFLNHRTERGLVLAREWEVWDNPLRYQVCEGAGLNALFYKALCDAAYLGEQIGETAGSRSFAASAEQLRTSFDHLLWNSNAGAYHGALFGAGTKMQDVMHIHLDPTQIVDGAYPPTVQAALFALYSGIIPAEKENAVRNWILAHLDQVEGPMSHYYLFHALYWMQTEAKDREVVARIKTGWEDQVDSPWQTNWEGLHDGSKVHIYGIVPGYFLTAFILGVRRMGPVTDHTILIEPRCGNLTSAEGVAVTEFGPVKMKWSKASDDRISIECDLPPKTKTTLRLYRFGDNERIVIDQLPHQAVVRGSFLEVPLLPGSHMIQYTGSRTSS